MGEVARTCRLVTYRKHTDAEIEAEPQLEQYLHSDTHEFTASRAVAQRIQRELHVGERPVDEARDPQVEVEGIEYFRAHIEKLLNRLTSEAETWAESNSRLSGQQVCLPVRRPLDHIDSPRANS